MIDVIFSNNVVVWHLHLFYFLPIDIHIEQCHIITLWYTANAVYVAQHHNSIPRKINADILIREMLAQVAFFCRVHAFEGLFKWNSSWHLRFNMDAIASYFAALLLYQLKRVFIREVVHLIKGDIHVWKFQSLRFFQRRFPVRRNIFIAHHHSQYAGSGSGITVRILTTPCSDVHCFIKIFLAIQQSNHHIGSI